MSMMLLRNMQTSPFTFLYMNILIVFLLKMNRIKYYKPKFFLAHIAGSAKCILKQVVSCLND